MDYGYYQDKYQSLMVNAIIRKAEADEQVRTQNKIRELEIENAVLKERLNFYK